MKILMRRLIRSRLIWISTVCKCVSEFTRCPKLPDFNLDQGNNLLRGNFVTKLAAFYFEISHDVATSSSIMQYTVMY